jgi:hypothetical protein
MSTTIDTFIYLKKDIEQSFQRVQTITTSSHYNPHELDQLLNHISCTLDDLQKINQLLRSHSTHPLDLSDHDDDFEDTTRLVSKKRQKDQNDESLLSSNSNFTSSDEREEFVRNMKTQLDYYKTKVQSIKKDAPMEIIRLDLAPEEETEDRLIAKQDAQIDDMHLSIVSLKNLTQNINLEINDHIRVLDNLETNMVHSQNGIENLTKRTKEFIRISSGGVGGHTCLFCIAVGLFFLIVILILFF